jgi:hypothetical protein
LATTALLGDADASWSYATSGRQSALSARTVHTPHTPHTHTYEDVGRLEVSVDDGRGGAVEEFHALGDIARDAQPQCPPDLFGLVCARLQKVVQVALASSSERRPIKVVEPTNSIIGACAVRVSARVRPVGGLTSERNSVMIVSGERHMPLSRTVLGCFRPLLSHARNA